MKLKLSKGLSYSGNGVNATNKKPYVTCTDEIGKKLLATGYFKEEAEETAVSDEKSSDSGSDTGTADKKPNQPKRARELPRKVLNRFPTLLTFNYG